MSESLWLPGGVHAELDRTSAGARTGVVLVPPFGWEEQASCRLRRVWARRLTGSGHPVLRLDLPGTADSADPAEDDVLPAWVQSVSSACALLRQATGCPRVAVVGLGLGGLPAMLAASAGAADDVALWATPTRGRAAVRALQAFARLHAAGAGPDDGRLHVSGFVLSAGTVASLSAVDLSTTPLPGPGRRVLLLGRDGADPDAGLAEALRTDGVEVTAAAGRGWTELVGHPMTAVLPEQPLAVLEQWLASAPAESRLSSPHVAAVDRLDLPGGVTERAVRLRTGSGDLFAVVTEPVDARSHRTLVLLNAGALPHTGPNRLWVRAARQAAGEGVAAVRLDLPGIGETPAAGEGVVTDADFYTPERTVQVRQALDALVDEGRPGSFVLAGLCSGAYWSFQLGASDARVTSVVLLNPLALLWHHSLPGAHRPDLRQHLRWERWQRLLAGQTGLAGVLPLARALLRDAAGMPAARRARLAARAEAGEVDPLLAAFQQVQAAQTEVVLAFSDEEPLLLEMQRDGLLDRVARLPGVRLHRLGGPSHAHELAPLPLQTGALDLLVRAATAGAATRLGRCGQSPP